MAPQKPEDLKKKKKKDKDGGASVQLLDSKRAMNVGIALAKLRAPVPAVVACLTSMCCRQGRVVLSMMEITNLATLCPSDEEVRLVKGFKGDPAKLAPAEKFMLALADVPQARAVAQGLAYQATFDERLREATSRIALFSDALAQIRGATRLQRLLKAVLVLGNKMNGVTKKSKRGLTKAFTVASLQQLHLTKAFDQQTSVLQYLIKLLKHKDPDLLRLERDFKGTTLTDAKRIPLDILQEDMRELRDGLTALEAVVREAAQSGRSWGAMSAGGGDGPTYVEEEVDSADAGRSRGGQRAAAGAGSASDDEGAAGAGKVAEAATSGEGGDGGEGEGAGDPTERKKKKRIRRRVEPLPEFAALAQGELSRLEGAFTAAQDGYKGMLKYWKEDTEMPADELFGHLHAFVEVHQSTA